MATVTRPNPAVDEILNDDTFWVEADGTAPSPASHVSPWPDGLLLAETVDELLQTISDAARRTGRWRQAAGKARDSFFVAELVEAYGDLHGRYVRAAGLLAESQARNRTFEALTD